MNTEIIKKRISVRTYKEQEIAQETLEKVKSFIEQDKGLFNVPITFTILDANKTGVSSPVIIGANTYIAAKYKKQKNAEISLGYAFEKLVLYATSLGLGTVWLAATIDRKAFEKAIDLKEDEVMPVVTPIGYAGEKRSLRESMMRKGMKSDSRIPFDQLFFQDNFDKPLNKENSDLWALPLEMVRKGYERASTGDIQKVDLGIALCHFEIAAKESGLQGTFVQKDPGISIAEDMEYIASFVLEV